MSAHSCATVLAAIGLASALIACAGEGTDTVDEVSATEGALQQFESARAGAAAEPAVAENHDDASVASTLACTLSVSAPTKSGNTITGKASRSSGCGTGTSRVSIQRSRWYGWEFMASREINGPGSVSYNCAGTGTHDFRTIQEARNVGMEPLVKTSSSVRFSCGN